MHSGMVLMESMDATIWGYKNFSHIEMYLRRAYTQLPPPLHLFIYPLYLSLSHIVAPLWSFAMSPFRMQRRGPCEFRPLALKLNSEDGVIWELPGGCQLALGWADQVAGMVDACPCQAPTAFPSVDICCV